MAGPRTKGKCKFCEKEFSKGWMDKHLATCPVRTAEDVVSSTFKNSKIPAAKFFDLEVEGFYAPMYWMYLKMPVTATLADLDIFLRNEWLECCGHLSAFRIGGDNYVSVVDKDWGMDDRSMDEAILGKILSVGDQFSHEYDFGTTTELKLKVLAEHAGKVFKGEKVEILARNNAPEIKCVNCGELATEICTECMYEDGGLLCVKCAKEHECDEDMFLPVVNSPRIGMCAYGT